MSVLCEIKGRGFLKAFALDEDGQGMTEYILLIFLIAIACLFGLKMYGGTIKKGYSKGAATLGNLTR